MLSVMKDVPLWMRENQIEKLKSVEDGEFFDLVCSEVLFKNLSLLIIRKGQPVTLWMQTQHISDDRQNRELILIAHRHYNNNNSFEY